MKYVLITGCNGGIGSAICTKFKEKKWFVIGTDMNSMNGMNETNGSIDRFIKADLTDENDIINLVQSIEENENRLNCLVNNAAYQLCKPMIETTGDEFKKVLNCNVVGPFLLATNTIKLLSETNGNIINIGSVHALNSSDKIAAYACSKSAIVGLTKNMAIEFSKYNVRVNCVSPGAINTPMLRAGLNRDSNNDINEQELIDSLGKKHVIGRIGEPEEVADLIYFLANKNISGNITGSNLIIDGGATIKLSTE